MESALGGSLESGGQYRVGAFSTNLTTVAMKAFSDLNYVIKKFCKMYTFYVISKIFSAINIIDPEHKKVYFRQILRAMKH